MGAATHLPIGAGHNWMHTAEAGCMGSFCSPCFLFWTGRSKIIVNFFLFFEFFQYYHLKVYGLSVIMLWSMREKLPSHAKPLG